MIWYFNRRFNKYYAVYSPDVIVYDDVSADTHLLHPPASELFVKLANNLKQSADESKWCRVDESLFSDDDRSYFPALEKLGMLTQKPELPLN